MPVATTLACDVCISKYVQSLGQTAGLKLKELVYPAGWQAEKAVSAVLEALMVVPSEMDVVFQMLAHDPCCKKGVVIAEVCCCCCG